MASKKQKHKIRTQFRKKHQGRSKTGDLTREFQDQADRLDKLAPTERISGKGELTRKRTVIGAELTEDQSGGFTVLLDYDSSLCRQGRVLRVHGLSCVVETEDGSIFRCATRQLLKSLNTEQRHVVAAGDLVIFRPEGDGQGMIERIEPRYGVLSRTSRGRQHVIVTNVDQLLIIASAAEPVLKPNLIDRFLVTAEQSRITPIICINKIDLIDPADLQPLVGVYGQMGYPVYLVSAATGLGVERLRRRIVGRQSVVSGQSGVGKTSLLNAIDPDLKLRVQEVSRENQKGKHTTTTAQLIPLQSGGHIVDTPGIRQFQLWDIIPAELAGLMRDIRPYVNACRYPDCTHIHEMDCAVKDAVADGRVDARRYESYCQMFLGDD
ncbi:MAG: ribosome small subunit-dependent GTPase A [Planctomycetales bacterium]|nr:ribosome small subunit-dependent GTPase A [Planctomycetales bacterium]MCA9202629.1 ribosome small subunit-dependent GTPase A [Planctomycetales bacterium]MCA9220246.1 ribosome small subunit-dependent GTPase A [Planctomycetales bacterium]